ncbi:hypothetical protein Psch_00606 [Pelotomaculum schinkii]|uniref:Uncharacterized protein n=1 Tax=Pelotomaculum schinkii TaxID=78350 RepID=A0A4Y7RDG9_9FIRM|nr:MULTISPECIES: hypothetical protein [Pelotomaculum]TEB07065.1 hypothetical protein Psch_00606 [Pelotomaculum schinkii]TEB16980.1 hypothetical protein Psfp_00916 [Pelotomaculum sp. FP]
MHRVKRPSPEAKSFGFSQVHYRTTHDLPGDEPKAKTIKREQAGINFQLNAAGGPLGEEFKDKT